MWMREREMEREAGGGMNQELGNERVAEGERRGWEEGTGGGGRWRGVL